MNEIFVSIQGEGARQGTANVFVRFSGCNMRCDMEPSEKSPGGFCCDTEFSSGRVMQEDELLGAMKGISEGVSSVILTGGEPGLQVTDGLVDRLQRDGWYVAIETNGTLELTQAYDWIVVSPKVAEHCVKQRHANELRYVRYHGQGIPKPACDAPYKYISPACNPDWTFDPQTVQWCAQLVKENPTWRLSLQAHKSFGLR